MRFWWISKIETLQSRHCNPWFLSQFADRVFGDVAPTRWFRKSILMIFELPAGDVSKKWKKSHSRWGGVAKVVFCTPTLGADQQNNRLPCSMGVPMLMFATPLERERLFQKWCILCCCEFCWILGGHKVCKMGRPVRFWILLIFRWRPSKVTKSKMLLKPLVVAIFVPKRRWSTINSFWWVPTFPMKK